MPAKSEDQRQAAGIALAAKKGEMDPSELYGAAKDMYDSMSKEDLEDYASSVDESFKTLTKGNHRVIYKKIDESTFVVYDKNTKTGKEKIQLYVNSDGKKKLVESFNEENLPGKYYGILETFQRQYIRKNWDNMKLNEGLLTKKNKKVDKMDYLSIVIDALEYRYNLDTDEAEDLVLQADAFGYFDDDLTDHVASEDARILYQKYYE